jgi:hypothetical protein
VAGSVAAADGDAAAARPWLAGTAGGVNGFRGGEADAVVYKVSAGTGAVAWARLLGGAGLDVATSLAMLSSRALVVGGYSTSSIVSAGGGGASASASASYASAAAFGAAGGRATAHGFLARLGVAAPGAETGQGASLVPEGAEWLQRVGDGASDGGVGSAAGAAAADSGSSAPFNTFVQAVKVLPEVRWVECSCTHCWCTHCSRTHCSRTHCWCTHCSRTHCPCTRCSPLRCAWRQPRCQRASAAFRS